MKKWKNNQGKECKMGCGCASCGCGGAVYGLGFLGSAVYYISNATSFGAGVVGFLKALVWPAFLIFEAMSKLGM